jgi:uncharacterized protein (DUF4415 family)
MLDPRSACFYFCASAPMPDGTSARTARRWRARANQIIPVSERIQNMSKKELRAAVKADWAGEDRELDWFRDLQPARTDKKAIALRLDRDVINWFKAEAGKRGGYQTMINDALRIYIRAKAKKP